jgi:hypothetical protein
MWWLLVTSWLMNLPSLIIQAKWGLVEAAVTDLTTKAAAVKTAVNKAITDADASSHPHGLPDLLQHR